MLAFCEITSEVRGILLGSIVIIFVGIIDDIVQLKARYKLMGQIFAAVIPIIYGVRIDILTNFNFFSENQYLSLVTLPYP